MFEYRLSLGFHSPVCIKASWILAHATASAFLWNDLDVEPILRLRTCACHSPFLFLIEATLYPPCDKDMAAY